MSASDIAACYLEAWTSAAERFSSAFSDLQKAAINIPDGEVHDVLACAYWASWEYLRRICKSSRTDLRKTCRIHGPAEDEPSAGSATGFFFEHLVAALVLPRILSATGATEVEFNRCGHRRGETIPRRPDIYLRGPTGREVVFELKQSVRRPTYHNLQDIRARHKKAGICYLVIGGHLCLGRDALNQLREEKWAAFVDANDKATLVGLPTVDDHIRTAVQQLRGEP